MGVREAGLGVTSALLESSHSPIPREPHGVDNSTELSHLSPAGPAFVPLCQPVTDPLPPLRGGPEIPGISLQEQLSGLGSG